MAGPYSPVNPANPAKAASRRLCRARLAAAGFSTGMSDVRSCEARNRLAIVVRSMDEASCGALPVLEKGGVDAMVTDRYICLALAKRDARPGDITVREVMSKGPLHPSAKRKTWTGLSSSCGGGGCEDFRSSTEAVCCTESSR